MSASAGTGFVLEARQVTKHFGGTAALRGIDVGLQRGQVHALIGENGAGKSTLVRILAGVDRPTSGDLLFEGRPIVFSSTRDAAAHGVALIHQELQLFSELSIADNLFMGRERVGRWRTIDRGSQSRLARDTLATLGQQLDPRTLVGSLPLGLQQIVEIARALVHDTRVLLMDEPTSALSPSEVHALFGVIGDLAARGVSIVYISHRLRELLAVADTVMVLRDGRLVGTAPAAAVDVAWIVERMTGRDSRAGASASHGRAVTRAPLGGVGVPTDRREAVPAGRVGSLSGEPARLTVRNLTLGAAPGRAALNDISFYLRAGEVIGIYGSMGAGRTELLESLMGVHARAAGGITLDGLHLDGLPVHRRIAAGLAFVPEDRQRAGLVSTLSVLQNMTLSSLHRFERLGCVSGTREWDAARQLASDVRLETSGLPMGLDASVTALSGGNQQKVVIGRALMSAPRVLLMDEPSRGVDVGARADIVAYIRGLADAGLGIIFTSSDLDEILAAATRVLVLSRGRLVGEYLAEEATEAAIAADASGPDAATLTTHACS